MTHPWIPSACIDPSYDVGFDGGVGELMVGMKIGATARVGGEGVCVLLMSIKESM